MRILNSLLVLVLIAIAVHQTFSYFTHSLSGTQWSCSAVKKGFTSSTYNQYKKYEEFNALNFVTDEQLNFFQKGHLIDQHEGISDFELIYSIHYQSSRDHLSFHFKQIDWNKKGSEDFVRDKNSVAGLTFEYIYEVHDNSLFLTNITNAEDSNYVCFKAD